MYMGTFPIRLPTFACTLFHPTTNQCLQMYTWTNSRCLFFGSPKFQAPHTILCGKLLWPSVCHFERTFRLTKVLTSGFLKTTSALSTIPSLEMTEPSNDPNAAEHDLKKSSVPANAATLAAAAETLPSGIKSDTDQLPQAQAEGSSEAFEVVQVDWGKPHDPKSPMDWSKTRKWACVGLIGSVTLNA